MSLLTNLFQKLLISNEVALIPRTVTGVFLKVRPHREDALPVGTQIHNVKKYPGTGGILINATRTYATIVRRTTDQKVVVQLPIKLEYCLPQNCMCTVRRWVHGKIHMVIVPPQCNTELKNKPSSGLDKDNLTAVLYGIEDLRLEQRPIPTIKDNEVLLQMECVGICGSDVHYLVNGRIGDFILTTPMIIGHEASGTVVKVGPKVTNLAVGDRVAIEPGVPCRICNYCKEGRYNLCRDIIFCATPPCHGNLARYYAHAADFCFKLPPHMTLEEGALLEPLSVGVHACKKGGIAIGSTVLILGAGTIGLVTVLTAKAMGASKILITDLVQHRLDLAKSFGAELTLQIKTGEKDEVILKKIKELMGDQPTVSIDCSGDDQSVRLSIEATKTGGVAVMVGMGKPSIAIPLVNALAKEVDIRGSFRYANDYATALEMVASRRVNVKPLITHHFAMEDTKKAFHVTRTGEGNAVKVMIHANPNWKPK